MSQLKLYEIAAEIEAAMMEEELDEDRLSELLGDMETKASNIVAFAGEIDGFIEFAKAEEKRIAQRRKFAENRKEQLKAYLQNCMEQANLYDFDAGTHKLKIQKKPPSVVIEDEEALPAKFVELVMTQRIDKKAIKEALKNGEVPGASLSQGMTLRIK